MSGNKGGDKDTCFASKVKRQISLGSTIRRGDCKNQHSVKKRSLRRKPGFEIMMHLEGLHYKDLLFGDYLIFEARHPNMQQTLLPVSQRTLSIINVPVVHENRSQYQSESCVWCGGIKNEVMKSWPDVSCGRI